MGAPSNLLKTKYYVFRADSDASDFATSLQQLEWAEKSCVYVSVLFVSGKFWFSRGSWPQIVDG